MLVLDLTYMKVLLVLDLTYMNVFYVSVVILILYSAFNNIILIFTRLFYDRDIRMKKKIKEMLEICNRLKIKIR